MSQRKKILFVNHVGLMSGAETGMVDLVRLIDRERFEPVVLLPAPGPLAERFRACDAPVLFAQLHRFKKTVNPLMLLRDLIQWFRAVLQLRTVIRQHGVDLVHSNSTQAQLCAAPAARMAGVPSIWHCRDLAPLGAAGRFLYRLSNRIIAISAAVAADLRQYGTDARKVVVIRNGTDTLASGTAVSAPDLRTELAIPADAFVVAMVAQLVPWKEHPLFIEAAARAAGEQPALFFLVMGDDLFNDHPGYRGTLEELARARGLSGRMLFTGYRADMAAVYAGIDLLVHPASREPFGRVLIEAMAAGKPVIAVNAAGPAEIIENGVSGILVPPHDAAALSSAVMELAGNEALADRLGQAGRERVRSMFDARQTVRGIQSLYDEVFRNRNGSVTRATAPSHVGPDLASVPLSATRQARPVVRASLYCRARALHIAPPSLTHYQKPVKIAIDGMLLGRAFSGVEVCIHELAENLSRAGKQEYILFAPTGYTPGDAPHARFRIERPRLPLPSRAVRIAWEQLAFAGAARRAGAAVIHSPGYIAPIAARLPVVVTVYDTIALEHPEWCRRSNRLHYRLFLPLSIRKARMIIVPSDATQRDVARRFPDAAAKLVVIPPGIRKGLAPIRDPAALAAFREKRGLHAPYVLFVGNIEPKKNVSRLLEAFRMLKQTDAIDHKLVIAGRCGWKCADVFDLVRRGGLQQDVVFTGYVPSHELAALYSAADVFVFPSLYEGFGLPALEAMACGTPVIASDRGALPEVVGEAAVQVDPLDVPQIAAAMRQVLGDAELRQRLTGQGVARAAGFSWQSAVEKTDEVYIVAGGGSTPASAGQAP